MGRRLVEGREGAADGHEEGEEAEDEVVGGGDEAEEGGWGEEGKAVEGECESQVGDDGGGDEEWGGAGGLVGFPLILADFWVVDEPVAKGGHHAPPRRGCF